MGMGEDSSTISLIVLLLGREGFVNLPFDKGVGIALQVWGASLQPKPKLENVKKKSTSSFWAKQEVLFINFSQYFKALVRAAEEVAESQSDPQVIKTKQNSLSDPAWRLCCC